MQRWLAGFPLATHSLCEPSRQSRLEAGEHASSQLLRAKPFGLPFRSAFLRPCKYDAKVQVDDLARSCTLRYIVGSPRCLFSLFVSLKNLPLDPRFSTFTPAAALRRRRRTCTFLFCTHAHSRAPRRAGDK